MARTDTFACSVVTPEGVVADTEAQFVVLPAHDGEIGLLHDRAPLFCKLDAGRLRIETPNENLVFFVDGGFAEMVNNQLTILTEDARRPDELDREAAEKGLSEAKAMTVTDETSFLARQRALKRARVQLRLIQ
jgi:F-type H+-transporting ATPase subunit epsilon